MAGGAAVAVHTRAAALTQVPAQRGFTDVGATSAVGKTSKSDRCKLPKELDLLCRLTSALLMRCWY